MHVAICWRLLRVRLLRVLIHLHSICGLTCGGSGGLCLRSLCGLCGSLLAESLGLLLLLYTRWWRLARCIFQIHRRHEWLCELGLCDEWMQLRLLRRPSLERIDIEQSSDKVDECDAVVHFCLGQYAFVQRRGSLTSFDFGLFHVLSWHRVAPNDIR